MDALRQHLRVAFAEGTAEELAVALALIFKLSPPTHKTNDGGNFLKTASAAQVVKNETSTN
jgi:hypothetical protein